MKNCTNILLIAGTGQKVGKTLLACKIIGHLSQTQPVVAIKISPHFHSLENGANIIATLPAKYVIVKEDNVTNKDSSRMWQAGAAKSFYIQAKDEYLSEVLELIQTEIGNSPVICESGGLNRFIKPGVFILVKGKDVPKNKSHYLQNNPIVITLKNGFFDFDVNTISIQNNSFEINN